MKIFCWIFGHRWINEYVEINKWKYRVSRYCDRCSKEEITP